MNRDSKIFVILNPAAHSERARGMRDKIAALSSRAVVQTTASPGDARALAKFAVRNGYKTIVAAGGDGTINEVVNGMATSGTTLGILPVGTMNVFAAELGVPSNLNRAWEVIESGHTRKIDLVKANDSYFVQLAGAGLDAEVVERTTVDSKKVLGPISYLLTLAQVAAGAAPKVKIQPLDSHAREGSFVLVGNGRYYGGPFTLFKDAKLDDGLLDVLVFQNQTHWDIIRYVQAAAFGTHSRLHDVEYFQTSGLSLSSEVHVPVEVDGELTGALPYKFRFSSRKLRVLVPASAKAGSRA